MDGRRALLLPLLGAAALLLVSACSGPPPLPVGHPVGISLKDFAIEASTPAVHDGNVDFQIFNGSPSTHEFVLARSDLPANQLPLSSDGLRADEDKFDHVGEISEVDTQTNQDLVLHLAPGRYIFYCNLEGHYLGGMYGVLEVSNDVPST
jgi:uncharacterized cupredoxin-like copper-binding protein